jgi:DNA-binding transcriptional LysR family regulator
MDTGLLTTFRQVARLGSITAAADALGYTQSAVSRQVAALEDELGARLFDRLPRGVRATEHGRALLAHAEAVLMRLDDARRELEAIDRLELGRLRVGAFPTAMAELVPSALAEFRERHPGVELTLSEGTTPRQLRRLEDGEIDVAVISAFPDQPRDPDLMLVRLLDDRMLLALERGHRLAGRRRVRLIDVAHESWIGADSSDDGYILGPGRAAIGGGALDPRLRIHEWTAKLGLVAAGLGVTLVPSLARSAVRPDVALVALHPRDVPPRSVYAAGARDIEPSRAAVAFIDALRRAAAVLGGGGVAARRAGARARHGRGSRT